MTALLVLADLLLLAGLTARLVRLVVLDDLGRWWLRQPAERWAIRHDGLGPLGENGNWPALYDTAVFQRHGMVDNEWVPTWTAATAFEHDQVRVTDPIGWRSKLVSGLSCPWCVGFWIAGVMLGVLALVGGPGDAHEVWRYVAGWFTLNYVVAHVGPRLGDTG